MSDKPRKFKGGVHPNDSKTLSASKPIQDAPLLDAYQVIMHQNIGAPPELVVKKGDGVKKGKGCAVAPAPFTGRYPVIGCSVFRGSDRRCEISRAPDSRGEIP